QPEEYDGSTAARRARWDGATAHDRRRCGSGGDARGALRRLSDGGAQSPGTCADRAGAHWTGDRNHRNRGPAHAGAVSRRGPSAAQYDRDPGGGGARGGADPAALDAKPERAPAALAGPVFRDGAMGCTILAGVLRIRSAAIRAIRALASSQVSGIAA